jgi:predicted helicase
LSASFGTKPSPEDIFYYIYSVFYSTIYRETYGEYLKIDFPRVPFTSDYTLFKKIGDLGKKLADLHLLKATAFDNPIAKCPIAGPENRIEKISYNQDEQRIYFNNDKYFDGVAPEVWKYHIGGYQVLHKYLKDRKGREMDEASQYCRIITAVSKTITIQQQIDDIYPEIELNFLNF